MLPEQTLRDAEALLQACRNKHVRIATAESCTGGLVAAALTAIPGASDVLDRGFVSYSNDAKHDMLGVPLSMIEQHGAVSLEVASAMATGALDRSNAGIAVSVTGLAGPGGGSPDKPIGLVCFGIARRGQPPVASQHVFPGDRSAVRAAAVAHAIALMGQNL